MKNGCLDEFEVAFEARAVRRCCFCSSSKARASARIRAASCIEAWS